MNVIRKWNTNIYDLCFNKTADTLYFINSTWGITNTEQAMPGIYFISLNDTNPAPQLIISNPNKYEMWTAIAINFFDNSMWVANSFNFITDGEIIIYDGLNIRRKFSVGNMPTTIRFR
jgi:hypothetical protein